MPAGTIHLNFVVTDHNLKDAKKKIGSKDLYVVDITKIIKELGYDVDNLSIESEFVINFSVMKKIQQGIYNTKSKTILVINRETSEIFVSQLQIFLDEISDLEYEIDLLS
jgi:hypothetical protein